MKELSIEEKARRYDEAKLRMSAAYNSNRCTIGFMNEIFPELKESEDERIREALIEMVHDTTGDSLWVDYNVHKEDALAWLEKQGEQKPAESNQEIKPNGGIVCEDFREGDGYYKVNLAYLSKSQVELIENLVVSWQNTANIVEWSEEDKILEDCIGICLTDISEQRFDDFKTSLKECLDWLHSLKDRMWYQPTQEWSKKDKMILGNILFDLEALRKSAGTEEEASPYQEEINWLKSLRPRSQWKPSEEQMMAIDTAINVLGKGTLNGKYLIELQEQLKKLKDEK